MIRLTFGVKSSPFLVSQILHQIAEDYQEKYHEAANDILAKGKKHLRKWRTNSAALKATITEDYREKDVTHFI